MTPLPSDRVLFGADCMRADFPQVQRCSGDPQRDGPDVEFCGGAYFTASCQRFAHSAPPYYI